MNVSAMYLQHLIVFHDVINGRGLLRAQERVCDNLITGLERMGLESD